MYQLQFSALNELNPVEKIEFTAKNRKSYKKKFTAKFNESNIFTTESIAKMLE